MVKIILLSVVLIGFWISLRKAFHLVWVHRIIEKFISKGWSIQRHLCFPICESLYNSISQIRIGERIDYLLENGTGVDTSREFNISGYLVRSCFMVGKYKVIILCGGTRFKGEFMEAQKRLTLSAR